MLSIFLVSSSILFHLADLAIAVMVWTLHALLTMVKVFAVAEACCAVVLLLVIGIFRVGRIPTKPRQPLLGTKSPSAERPLSVAWKPKMSLDAQSSQAGETA